MSIKNKYLAIIPILAMVSGCKQVPMMPGLTAHKIDIQQGNAVTQEMVSKLQLGMTRNQVRFVLGTPLLVDPFRTDRWDYFYSYMQRGEVIEQRRLVVFFKEDKLDRMEGDVIPAKPVADKAMGENKPKGEQAKPVATELKPDAAKPEVKPDAAKPLAADAPAAATLTTSTGTPVGSGVANAVEPPAAKPAVPKPDVKTDDKPKQERGFFGRMLEKIGL